jgi:hypothetical protein
MPAFMAQGGAAERRPRAAPAMARCERWRASFVRLRRVGCSLKEEGGWRGAAHPHGTGLRRVAEENGRTGPYPRRRQQLVGSNSGEE